MASGHKLRSITALKFLGETTEPTGVMFTWLARLRGIPFPIYQCYFVTAPRADWPADYMAQFEAMAREALPWHDPLKDPGYPPQPVPPK